MKVENTEWINPRLNRTNPHNFSLLSLASPSLPAFRTPNPPFPLSRLTSPPPPCSGYRRRELCSPSVSAAVVTTATNPATSRSPMNYPAWRPTGNIRIIPTPSTRTQAPVHIQAQAQVQGTPGQAMRLIHWRIPQACLQLEDQELEEDPRTVTASKPTLVTQAMVGGMEVEMGARHPRRQRNLTEEAKYHHQTPVSTYRVLGAIVTTWALGLTQPSI